MVWEKSDHKVICSSIAMLQERFRQLEKLKEMREERELLKVISFSSNNHHQCNSYYDHHYSLSSNILEPSKYIFHSEILDSQLLSLTLWPSSQTKKYADSFWDTNEKTQTLSSKQPSWLTNVALARPTLIKNVDDSSVNDVDTTLHL